MGDDWAAHVPPHGPLVRIAGNLWQVTASGGPLPRNMAVWRQPDGGLWLHSVIALDPVGLDALEALGPVATIVVPNAYHRLDCAVYADRYPDARVVAPAAARAAVAKRCRVDATCEEGMPGLGVVAHTPRGTKPGELAYELPLDDGGRALVVADLLFNLVTAPPGLPGFVLRYVTDSVGPLHISRVFRFLALEDRATYAAWVAEMAALPELRALSVAHGDAVISDAGARLAEAAARIARG